MCTVTSFPRATTVRPRSKWGRSSVATPRAPRRLEGAPRRYELEGTGAVLMEVPFAGPAESLVRLGEHAEAAGLLPVIAHPERAGTVLERPAVALELAERGWLLQGDARA